MRCLIGESDDATRSLLEKILESMGHRVDKAHNEEEVIELSEDNSYDIVILARTLPAMSGTELTKNMPNPEESYVFLLASEVKEEDVMDAVMTCVDDFLVKPLEKEQVKARVQTAERIINDTSSKPFDPVSVLEDEHALWRRMTKVFKTIVSRSKSDIPPEILGWIESTTLTLDSKIHHKKEMYFLLNFLENATKEHSKIHEGSQFFDRASLHTIEEEHEELEDLIDEIQNSIREYLEDESELDTIKNKIDSYSSLVSDHIEREERSLFPLASKYFYREDLLELEEKFDSIDEDAGKDIKDLPERLKRAEEILGL